jgi:hypothetical protein
MNWLSFIAADGEPIFVNLDNVERFTPARNAASGVTVTFADGRLCNVRCTMQDIAVHGGFPVTVIEPPVPDGEPQV